MSYVAYTHFADPYGKLLLAVQLEPKEIGRRLKAARKRKSHTQLSFALEANVSPGTVARWEAGGLPPIRELVRIAELLEIDPSELVETEVEQPRGDDRWQREITDEIKRGFQKIDRRLAKIEEGQRADAASRTRR